MKTPTHGGVGIYSETAAHPGTAINLEGVRRTSGMARVRPTGRFSPVGHPPGVGYHDPPLRERRILTQQTPPGTGIQETKEKVMKITRRAGRATVAVAVLFCFCATVRAQGVLDQVPSDAWVVLRINKLEQTNKKAAAWAEAMG